MAAQSTSVLNPEVYADLKLQLQLNLEKIMHQYGSYVHCVRKSIMRMGISAGDLCAYLLALPAFDSSKLKLSLLSDIRDDLEKATTINGIFNVLNSNYATFINYEIFKCMADDYDLDQFQEKMKYPEHLDAYIKMHKLSEFEDINPMLRKLESGSKKMILKFDIEMTCALAKIKDLTTAVAKLLGLRPSALRLLHIEEGCVLMTSLIPALAADLLFGTDKVFTEEQVAEFQALSILWLKCNGDTYDFTAGLTKNDQNGQNLKEDIQADDSGKIISWPCHCIDLCLQLLVNVGLTNLDYPNLN